MLLFIWIKRINVCTLDEIDLEDKVCCGAVTVKEDLC